MDHQVITLQCQWVQVVQHWDWCQWVHRPRFVRPLQHWIYWRIRKKYKETACTIGSFGGRLWGVKKRLRPVQTLTAPCHSPVPDSHSIEKWAWLGTELIKVTPTAKHWGTALVCKMLLGGEKRTFRTKNTPVPTCARLSFKLKIRYISILHPVKKKCIFCTQKRLKNT